MSSRTSAIYRIFGHPIAAIFASAMLRLYRLGEKSLWLDEVLSLRAARAPLGELVLGNIERYHPPLYSLLLGQWMRLGETAFHLRLLSALVGIVAVALIYPLALRLFGCDVAQSAIWFAALSPLLVWYAQEARDYSLLLMLTLLAMVALVELLLAPRVHWFLLFSVATAVAFHTHYVGVMVLALHAVVAVGLFASRRTRFQALAVVLLGWSLAVLLTLPWLRTPAASAFLELLRSDRFWMEAVTVGSGYLPPALERAFAAAPTRYAALLAAMVFLSLVAVAVLVYWLVRRHRVRLLRMRGDLTVRVGMALLYVVALAISVVPRGYTVKRYSLVLWPVVLVGAGWLWPWRRNARTILAVLLALSAIASLANVALVPKAEWDEAARLVLSERQAGDVVVLSPPYLSLVFDHYAGGEIPLTGIRGDTGASLAELSTQYERAWFVAHTTDVGPRRDEIEAWLDLSAEELRSERFFRIDVGLYRLPEDTDAGGNTQ